MLNLKMEDLDRYKNENWDIMAEDVTGMPCPLTTSFRSILQRCGDEMKSFFGMDCFMKKLHMTMLKEQNEYAVISDMRLKEEQDWLVAHTNPIFIKIVRDVKKDKDSAHRTESEVDELGYDVLLENNGSFEDLYKQIDNILESSNTRPSK